MDIINYIIVEKYKPYKTSKAQYRIEFPFSASGMGSNRYNDVGDLFHVSIRFTEDDAVIGRTEYEPNAKGKQQMKQILFSIQHAKIQLQDESDYAKNIVPLNILFTFIPIGMVKGEQIYPLVLHYTYESGRKTTDEFEVPSTEYFKLLDFLNDAVKPTHEVFEGLASQLSANLVGGPISNFLTGRLPSNTSKKSNKKPRKGGRTKRKTRRSRH